jgi:hypothetical protein
MLQPQKKVNQFIEEFSNARSYKEALEVLKKAETYFNVEGDYSVIPLLVNGYYLLEELQKAERFNQIYLEVDKTGQALYFQSLI